MTTRLVAIADQSSMPVWDWKGWAIVLGLALVLAVASAVREENRRAHRRRDGRR